MYMYIFLGTTGNFALYKLHCQYMCIKISIMVKIIALDEKYMHLKLENRHWKFNFKVQIDAIFFPSKYNYNK